MHIILTVVLFAWMAATWRRTSISYIRQAIAWLSGRRVL